MHTVGAPLASLVPNASQPSQQAKGSREATSPSYPQEAAGWDECSLGEVSALGSTADVTEGAVSGKLSAAVKGAMLADHSCFPVARGGRPARRAWLRIVASISWAVATILLTVLAVGHPACGLELSNMVILSAISSWAVIALESLLQRAMHWRQALHTPVAAFETSRSRSFGPEATFGNTGVRRDVDLGAVFEGVEVKDDDSDDCHVSSVASMPSPADIAAQRLVQEYGRLAPTVQATAMRARPPAAANEVTAQPIGRPLQTALPSRAAAVASKVAEPPGSLPDLGPKEQSNLNASGNSGKTGSSLLTASVYPSSKVTQRTESSSYSVLSLLSLRRHAPKVDVQEPCDLESLKLRYIESISSKRDLEPDKRIDNCVAPSALQRIEEAPPSLRVSFWCMLVALLSTLCLALLALHEGSVQSCWPMRASFLAAAGGWLVAVLVFDVVAVFCTAVLHWRAVEERMAARRDQRWQKVKHQREQKAHSMQSAACAP
mmetsp:Transcript_24135/g.44328  ORF Transcript_24135/g.44328 Transcript_24135/m.44328 type:complete len:491 (-) Transcript_24135:98-1570(-)